MPRSKRLLTDEASNVLVYMTGEICFPGNCPSLWVGGAIVGHGGDGFLKFQDHEEISSDELADAFQQMWQKKRLISLSVLHNTISNAVTIYTCTCTYSGSNCVMYQCNNCYFN